LAACGLTPPRKQCAGHSSFHNNEEGKHRPLLDAGDTKLSPAMPR
jgi:hypothetical protein